MFFSVPSKYCEYLDENCADPFVMSFVQIAAKNNESIEVIGSAVSKSLIDNIEKELVPALSKMGCGNGNTKITSNYYKFSSCNQISATGISLGVDSFYSILSNLSNNNTKLPFKAVVYIYQVDKWKNFNIDDLQHTIHNQKIVADSYDLQLIPIVTNIRNVMESEMVFSQFHTFCDLGTVASLKKLIGGYYYASAYSRDEMTLSFTNSGNYDNITEEVFTFDGFRMFSSGGEVTRFEKTRIIADNNVVYNYLDVCYHDAPNNTGFLNCSSCAKCVRTMASLELLGKLGNYDKVFDINLYHKNIAKNWGDIEYRRIIGKDHFSGELCEIARSKGFKIPVSHWVYFLLKGLKNQINKIINIKKDKKIVEFENMKKVMLVFGTRPEAIKMCPLVNELKTRENIKTIVCVTGQHRQMLDQVLNAFNVEPNYDLSIMKDKQTLFDVTINILERIKEVLEEVKPDVVLVHGDTSTTFVTALACFYLQIPVGHVEAGLRTYNIYSPYPEEFNRQAVGIVSHYNFAPTDLSKQNLLNEGKKPETIYVTGNTAIDALKTTVREDYTHPELEWAEGSRLIMITAHRRENLGEPMKNMFRAIKRVMDEHPDVKAIYPIHMNPVVRETADSILGGDERIRIIEPLEVLDFHNFLNRSFMILTDSGGIQEEAPSLGKPVLVMRDTTERPEGIAAGTLKLVGTEEETIYNEFKKLLENEEEYAKMSNASNPYGDGFACKRIADILERGYVL